MTDPTDRSSSSGKASPPLRRGVAAVFVRDAKLLVIRRSAHVEAPGAWCFPGGGVEPGESEEEAIRREMREELGAEVFPRRRLWRCVTAWKVALSWWLTEFQPLSELRIDRREVDAACWLPIDQILSLPNLLSSNREFLHAVQRGEIELEGD